MIVPVILTGGSGTRLWPISRKSYPKQFQSFGRDTTLFQDAALRVSGPAFGAPMVLTGEDFRFIVEDQLRAVGVGNALTLVEPEGRNTAPAILAATLATQSRDAQALILILPADHLIPDAEAFAEMVLASVPAARAGQIVTFGVTPTRPETGFGYLEMAETSDGTAPVQLERFVEKPDSTTAEQLVASDRYLWNAGIFLSSVSTMRAAFEVHAPEMVAPVQAALDQGQVDLSFTRLAAAPWEQVPDVSIDYAIMEKVTDLSVMPFWGEWSDLGSWEAIWQTSVPDASGNAAIGDVARFETEDTLIYRDPNAPQVTTLGLKDMVVVSTKDAVLVASKSRSQEVGAAVRTMAARGEVAATQTPRHYRPWGWYETLVLGARFQVKRIVVKPGGVLSLQSHHHRSEHWIVVEGTARVTVGKDVKLVSENESVYIPLGKVHRMENPGKFSMVLIEVQTGAYLGEDDIVRFEDTYGRIG